ncbi:DUF5691 domain-containing protein [Komagataeibacter rhaeticus]|uniref:DUF5691 domain-containing protein n=1 Tax=Komagataeibacter rhaeticus TaxID=215221 RepID=UPI001A5D4AA8|nr:DUF5691 domain-containing protein [Komagataeibacter rhaeticus]MBL7238868.1 hypothetical protein [Komagataeibacter rhaeticus]
MAEPLEDMMGTILARWAMGSPAAPIATPWRSVLGNDPAAAELRLLALCGQFLATMSERSVPEDLHALPTIPPATQPAVPDALLPSVRRLLGRMDNDMLRDSFVRMLARRGWCVYPSDWMPRAKEGVPAAYAPWQDWMAAVAAGAPAVPIAPAGPLNAENWDAYGTATRGVAFALLRASDPTAARTLLESRLADARAEERLHLLGLFGHNLSPADIPFLQATAAADRAPKVREMATNLLVRLGYGGEVDETAAELADCFSMQPETPGSDRLVPVPRAIKTDAGMKVAAAQAARRRKLFSVVTLSAFAAALHLSVEELIRRVVGRDDHNGLVADLIEMVMKGGSDAIVATLVEAWLATGCAQTSFYVVGCERMAARVSVAQRLDMARAALVTAGGSFGQALSISQGWEGMDNLMDTPAGRTLLVLPGQEGARLDSTEHAAELLALGVLATPAAARMALAALEQAGLPATDPRLDMLKLNIALEKTGARE